MTCGKGHEYSTPYCTNFECISFEILRTELDPRGGVFLYVKDYKYPLRALPEQGRLSAVNFEKRAIISTPRFFARLVRGFYSPVKVLRAVIQWLSELYAADYMGDLKIPENLYCEFSQEVMRALHVVNPFEETDWIRLIGIIPNEDMAYRNRAQDVFPLVNKDNLRKNPRKELLRVLDISIERELTSQKNKMKMVRKLVSVGMLLKPIRKLITDFFLELNFERIKPDINDRYWTANRFEYNYEGKTYEERMRWKEEEDKNWERPIDKPKEPDRPRITIQEPNKEFFDLNEKDAEEMANQAKQALMMHYRKVRESVVK